MPLWGNHVSKNVENAWQFSKVYPAHHDPHADKPNARWYSWFSKGIADSYAHRYPMGKGAKPLYSWWNGEKLDYIEARRKIYALLYAQAVKKYQWDNFIDIYLAAHEGDITIQDFDAYNHHDLGYTLKDVFKDTNRKMGHGFVLAKMIEQWKATF